MRIKWPKLCFVWNNKALYEPAKLHFIPITVILWHYALYHVWVYLSAPYSAYFLYGAWESNSSFVRKWQFASHGACVNIRRRGEWVSDLLTDKRDSCQCHLLSPGSKVLQNDEFTKDLFRFLQLLCEGHNNGRWDTSLFSWPKSSDWNHMILLHLHVSKQAMLSQKH